MSLRVCNEPGCPELVQRDARGGRCARHRKAADKARGTSAARGYGAKHRRLSERERSSAIGQTCVMCGDLMRADQQLALDHTPDRTGYRGVVHLSCNARDGAQRGNAAR